MDLNRWGMVLQDGQWKIEGALNCRPLLLDKLVRYFSHKQHANRRQKIIRPKNINKVDKETMPSG